METTFKITIGSSPHISNSADCLDYLNHDIHLIKAALLYSDKVEVCSPMGNLIHTINSIRKMPVSSKIEDKISLLNVLLEYNHGRHEIGQILNSFNILKRKKHLSGAEIILKNKFVNELNKIWKDFHNANFELVSGDNIKDILKLYEEELIEYYFFNVSQKNIKEELLSQFTEYITTAISNPYSYPLLDDLSGLFISEKISQGKIQVSNLDIEKSKSIHLAANLFERLPNFDLASVDEILDIKKELAPYLINFRSGMINLSELISSSQWSTEFKKETEIIFRKNIAPSILDIEETIKTKTYFKSLISRFSNTPYSLPIPVFGVALAGQISNYDILSIILDGLIVGANLYDIYNQLEKEKLAIKQNQLFFYYKAKKSLQK